MPRNPAKITQADVARAYRVVSKETGAAEIIFEADGVVRVVPHVPRPDGDRRENTDKGDAGIIL